jgi:hypothetical protein
MGAVYYYVRKAVIYYLRFATLHRFEPLSSPTAATITVTTATFTPIRGGR